MGTGKCIRELSESIVSRRRPPSPSSSQWPGVPEPTAPAEATAPEGDTDGPADPNGSAEVEDDEEDDDVVGNFIGPGNLADSDDTVVLTTIGVLLT